MEPISCKIIKDIRYDNSYKLFTDIVIDGYGCPYCDHVHPDKVRVEKHIEECPYNPDNKCCATCKSYQDSNNGYYDSQVEYCRNILAHKINDGRTSFSKTCEYWEQKEINDSL